MSKRPEISLFSFVSGLCLLLFAADALAQSTGISNAGVLDKVISKFNSVASGWATEIEIHATRLFWLLAMISMVWTFGMMILRKADIGEFFAEFLRFTLFTGFFLFLLENGAQLAIDIMASLRTVAAKASALDNDISPSGIVDVGFDVFSRVVQKSSIWSPTDSLFGLFFSAAILIVFALVGTNMLLLTISGWLFAYAGIFILGFGGCRWTSDMAIGYFKSVLNVALQLFTMVLLIGLGRQFVNDFYTGLSADLELMELAVMAVVAAVLLFLVSKLPPQIGALAGGTTGSMGSNFGAGTAVAAAAALASGIAAAGAAMAAGAAGTAGGAQALMAAFSKASAAESGGGGEKIKSGGSTDGGNGSSGRDAAANDAGGSGTSSLASAMGDAESSSQSSRASESSAPSTSSDMSNSGSQSEAAEGGSKTPGAMAGTGSAAAKAGKIAIGTVASLSHGAWNVAKNNLAERVANSAGGRIAASIKARELSQEKQNMSSSFEGDSLSAGSDSPDAASEIAAFRDRGAS